MQAQADKERFGDWNKRLASMLEAPMIRLYNEASADKKYKDSYEAYARQRALQVAQEVNDTTSTWLQEGRELASVFSAARVVMIATTEATYAKSAGRMVVAKATKKRLRWKVGRKPCKFCRSINGKTVKPGVAFGKHGDRLVFFAPAHPNCYCEVEIV